jgi:hypothetical protein
MFKGMVAENTPVVGAVVLVLANCAVKAILSVAAACGEDVLPDSSTP